MPSPFSAALPKLWTFFQCSLNLSLGSANAYSLPIDLPVPIQLTHQCKPMENMCVASAKLPFVAQIAGSWGTGMVNSKLDWFFQYLVPCNYTAYYYYVFFNIYIFFSLFIQIEKVLQQGEISECSEPYMVLKETEGGKVSSRSFVNCLIFWETR